MQQTVLHFIGAVEFGQRNPKAAALVIFVHGLAGNPFDTWRFGTDAFWPRWLAEDFPSVNVFCASYESSILSNPLDGSGASLSDRASILIDSINSVGPNAAKIVLVGHSLGGLVIKQMLRKLNDSPQVESKLLLSRIKRIVFIATPHSGSRLASSLIDIGKILSNPTIINSLLSQTGKELSLGNELLLELGSWFENWTDNCELRVFSYYETKKTKGVHVVDKMTANPHAKGCDPVAIEADHVDICKPPTRSAQLYASFSLMLNNMLSQAQSHSTAVVSAITTPEPFMPALEQTQTTQLVPAKVLNEVENQIFNASETASWIDEQLKLPPSIIAPELLVDFQFYTTVSSSDRRSLSEKLEASGRAYETTEAERKKERFSMTLQRHIAQPVALSKIIILMSDLETRFNRHVKPAIVNGANNEKINKVVQENIIDAILNSTSATSEELSAALVESCLYYLTGNCHIQWDHV